MQDWARESFLSIEVWAAVTLNNGTLRFSENLERTLSLRLRTPDRKSLTSEFLTPTSTSCQFLNWHLARLYCSELRTRSSVRYHVIPVLAIPRFQSPSYS